LEDETTSIILSSNNWLTQVYLKKIAVKTEREMMEVVVTTAAIRRAKLQSNRHHQQTITKFSTGWMPFLSPNQQCQSTEGKG